MIRYLGHVAVCRVSLPRGGVHFARPPEANFIDRHVWNKLERLGIAPSELPSLLPELAGRPTLPLLSA